MMNDCSEVLPGWKGNTGSFFPPGLVTSGKGGAEESSRQELLDEPREVGIGCGHLLAAAQHGYRTFLRASKSDLINPQGRKTHAKC